MNEQPRKPWYQFSLRTVFIVLTLLAIPCWYFGEQYRLVAKRRAMRTEIEKRHGEFYCVEAKSELLFPDERPTPIPWIRRWLGDETYFYINVNAPCSDNEMGLIKELFPEADVRIITWLNPAFSETRER